MRLLGILVLLPALAAAQGVAGIAIEQIEGDWVFVARPAGGEIRVQVAEAGVDAPALLGRRQDAAGATLFRPRFGLTPGVDYAVTYTVPGAAIVRKTLQVQAVERPATELLAIYPSSSVLPENLLKLYFEFSAPMSRGDAYQHVHLETDDGKTIALPFLELEQELWDPGMTRLTVFFDPARVKRGLLPHDEAGVPIEAGQHYTLAVGQEWPDAHGEPLKQGARKRFAVVAADRTPPDPDQWQLNIPAAGSREPLVLTFPEPLDRGLLQRVLRVQTPAGDEVPGEAAIADEERQWSFRPAEPWRPGRYQLAVDRVIEDLAGNQIDRPFEVDVFERVAERIAKEVVTIGFTVEP